MCDNIGEPCKRRIAQLLTKRDLALVEQLVVVLGGGGDGLVLGIKALDNHMAGFTPTPRPARHLCEKLKGTLAGSKIR